VRRAFLILLAVLALPSVAHAAVRKLPQGATIAGVDVGGLGPRSATSKLHSQLEPVWERPVTVRVGARDQQATTKALGFAIDYDGMVAKAFRLAAAHHPVHVRLVKSIASRQLSEEVARLGRPFYRAPRNARVRFGVTKIVRIHGHNGRGLDSDELRQALITELRRPTGTRVVTESVHTIHPKITVSELARVYATFISIDRPHFKLRLFKRLRLVRSYGVAVGMAGLETPAGLRHVLYKQVNPPWVVPNRSWAGSLAGQTIPPGDPRNPLKARFIGLGDGIGIHGTAEDWSIGTRASHGCIRMHVSDVINLYSRVPVGTPVLIR
jgi:L,D-transpeptidase catalytic domain